MTALIARSRRILSSVSLLLMAGLITSAMAHAAPGRGGRGGPSRGGGAGPSRAPSSPGRSIPQAGPGVGPGVGRVGEPGRPAAGPGPGAPGVAGPGLPGSPVGPANVGGVAGFIGAKPAATATRSAAAQGRVDSLQAALAGRTQPFTAGWYAEHPNAWQYTHPYANWWAVGGAVGLTRWLGYSVAAGATNATVTEAAATETIASDATAAADAPPSDLEWMPLGVYAAGPKGTSEAHIYLQLAVSRKGELKGNYYDAISNATQPITGSIDKDTRKATWKVGSGSQFDTTLDGLMTTPSDVTVKAGSSMQTWELVQMEQPKAAR